MEDLDAMTENELMPAMEGKLHIDELTSVPGDQRSILFWADIDGVPRWVLRIHYKDAMDEFIAKLQEHRNNVWGDT